FVAAHAAGLEGFVQPCGENGTTQYAKVREIPWRSAWAALGNSGGPYRLQASGICERGRCSTAAFRTNAASRSGSCGSHHKYEGDLTMAAEMVRPEAINFMATHGRGLICLAMTGERLDQLELTPMAPDNTALHGTAFTVSIDAKRGGCTTGISASD